VIENLIVPTMTRVDLLQRMVSSIDYPVEHLLIIDNGANYRESEAPVLHIPDPVQEVTYLPMVSNLGVAGAWNLGVKSFPFARRWFICSDDVVFAPGSMEKWDLASKPSALTISSDWPYFQFFTVGESVIERVGLFDEMFFPANFEDDDYLWRCEDYGMEVVRLEIAHEHAKQATVFDRRFGDANSRTYPINEARYMMKRGEGDLTAGDWSLVVRRNNEWALE
jgi:GT2 family glycosyltransferase